MTDWERRYREGDTPWEKGRAAPPLEEMLRRDGVGIWGDGPVIVPGCGTGNDVRALARVVDFEVIGVDLAPSAVEAAQARPPLGRERYLCADFLCPDSPLSGTRASAIWEHTCFCAIDPDRRRDYARAAANALKAGGRLIGVFFLDPWDPDEDPTQGPPFGATREEIQTTFRPWFRLEREWRPQNAFPGREGREWCAIFSRAAGEEPC